MGEFFLDNFHTASLISQKRQEINPKSSVHVNSEAVLRLYKGKKERRMMTGEVERQEKQVKYLWLKYVTLSLALCWFNCFLQFA